MNISKLYKELYDHPPWRKDKNTFMRLLKSSHFTDEDIIIFARLYVKYSHLHCFHINELHNYFQYILQKMNFSNPAELFKKTNKIYQDKKD